MAAEAGGPAGAVPREVEVDGPAVVVVVVVSGKAGVIAETAGRGGEVGLTFRSRRGILTMSS